MSPTSYLYHAANVEPEVGRMARAYARGDAVQGDMFKQKTLDIVERVLLSGDVSAAGKEEWGALRELVRAYETLDTGLQRAVQSYGVPFSMRFALSR